MAGRGNGPVPVRPRTETFTRYTETRPADQRYHGHSRRRAGRLWISTKKGISRFDPRTETFRNYDVSDGLQGDEFSRGCHQQGRNGEMFFCGSDGITAFSPEDIRDIRTCRRSCSPASRSQQTRLHRRRVRSPESDPIRGSVTLSYRHNVFSFEFAALSYANSHKNRYRYGSRASTPTGTRSGAGSAWLPTPIWIRAYVFRVQGSNSDGVWNEEGVSLPILITPPWYKRPTCFAPPR